MIGVLFNEIFLNYFRTHPAPEATVAGLFLIAR
jgi:hypothetical protein